jgi:hypothetical protein
MSRFNSRKAHRRLRLLALAAAVVAAQTHSASAQFSQWIGGSSNWNSPSNWSPIGVPVGAEVNVTSTLGLTQTVTYDYAGATTQQTLVVDLTAGGSVGASEILSMPAGNLTTLAGGPGEMIGDSTFFTGEGEVTSSNGVGSFNQSGGVNSTTALALGDNSTDTGFYNLSGTGSLVCLDGTIGTEAVGGYGTGVFNQSGGTNTTGDDLVIGVSSGSVGTYNLSGGALTSGFEVVGNGGTGNFDQSGGTNTINVSAGIGSDGLGLEIGGSGTSTYTLSGTGALSVSGKEYVGNGGTGIFNQTGGTNTNSDLYVGYPSGCNGTYTLSGNGSLLVGGVEAVAGTECIGIFNQSGGTNTVGSIEIGEGPFSIGTYALSGGTASVYGNVYIGGSSGSPGGEGTLTVSNTGQMTATGTVQVYNTGQLNINGGTIGATTLIGSYTQTAGNATFGQVTGGGKVMITGGETQLNGNGQASQIGGLTMSGTGTLDITNNSLIVNYGSGTDPAATIRGYLISGYNSGGAKWTGAGITSSAAAANPSQYAIGYADGGNPIDAANTGVPAGEIEVMYTVAGDANLGGSVDLSDLVIVASDFGMSGADWAEGDVNYDGNVDLSDLVIIASNFGASLNSIQSSDFSPSFAAEWQLALAETHGADAQLPEPAISGLSMFAVASFLRRRHRQRIRL